MITFLNENGYTIWILLVMTIMWVVTIKYAEGPPSPIGNLAILHSVEKREHSFLMNRTESKWGQD